MRPINRLLSVLLLIATTLPVYADRGMRNSQMVEYQIKASYIYNFLQFVKFPSDALRDDGEVVVCIAGENRFGRALFELDGAKTSQGLIHVELVEPHTNAVHNKRCNVLYVVGSEAQRARALLENVDPRKVLTIGEDQSFVRIGGSIELYIEDDVVRFRVNVEQVKQADFQVAAQLMEMGSPL